MPCENPSLPPRSPFKTPPPGRIRSRPVVVLTCRGRLPGRVNSEMRSFSFFLWGYRACEVINRFLLAKARTSFFILPPNKEKRGRKGVI